MRVHLDGQLWAKATGKTLEIKQATIFRLGANRSGGNKWDGDLDEFRVYDRILLDSQIESPLLRMPRK